MNSIHSLSQSFLKETPLDFKRYFFKSFRETPRMFFLIGPRGVGKTTSILQYLIDYADNDITSSKILYVPADHILLENISLFEVASNFEMEGGKVLCIDEIHKYGNWAKELKSIVDTYKGLRLIVSGSSSLEISKGSTDLSRRALVFNMRHMSFREFLEFEHKLELPRFSLHEILEKHSMIATDLVKRIEHAHHKVIPLFRKYLEKGLFPFYREYKTTESYYLALNQMINSSIENDILSTHPQLTGVTVKKMKALLGHLSTSCPFTPDLKKIKTALSITDERTLKQYLYYLDKLQIIINVEKASGKLKSMQKPEKIYIDNPNFMYALASGPHEDPDKGSLRETFVANILKGLHSLQIPDHGDFLVDGKYIFEVGGKSKGDRQIQDIKNAFVLSDDIETGVKNRIPLWLLGFLY